MFTDALTATLTVSGPKVGATTGERRSSQREAAAHVREVGSGRGCWRSRAPTAG